MVHVCSFGPGGRSAGLLGAERHTVSLSELWLRAEAAAAGAAAVAGAPIPLGTTANVAEVWLWRCP